MRNGGPEQVNGNKATERPPYRKVLFLRQPYPDNHVDSSFLRDLKRNGTRTGLSLAEVSATDSVPDDTTVNVHPVDLPTLLRQTLPITQHVASIFIFIAVFVRLSRGDLSATTLLKWCAAIAIGLRVWAWSIGERTTWVGLAGAAAASASPHAGTSPPSATQSDALDETSARPDRRTKQPVGTLIPLIALYLLSPALKTLTRATTSDSIWALSGTLFAVNVFLGDYRAIPRESPFRSRSTMTTSTSSWSFFGAPARAPHLTLARRAPLPSTLSLTAALSGSTVLASRLMTNAQVFSLLLFSTLWFGPFPLLRSSLSLKPTLTLTWFLSTFALVLLLRTVGVAGTGLASATLGGISVAAPLVRGWLYVRYKDRLSGPWDVIPPGRLAAVAPAPVVNGVAMSHERIS